MRILHTSDWHLGRSFGPVSLIEHQQQFIDWLVEQCGESRIDLVVIAGDVFDRAIAPTEAVVMFRDALLRLRETGAAVAVITGNHDGADRVASYDHLLDLSGVYVRGGYTNVGEVLQLDFEDGPLDLVMLPFLDPQAAPDDLPEPVDPSDDESADNSTADADDAFERRIRRTHQSVLDEAISATRPNLKAPRSIAVAHAFVAGATVSDSERQLTVGGAGTVDASLFDGFSYTALGHLHRPQLVTGTNTVRYSGTPLAYSFSEEHSKSITIIDMLADGSCTLEEVTVPVGFAVRTIIGTIDELLRAEPKSAVVESFIRAIITDRGVVLDAKQRLAAVYPHVVEIELKPQVEVGSETHSAIDLVNLSGVEAVEAFWVASVGEPPSDNQRGLLHQAIADAERKVES
jgi:exonuclease SbcD